MHKECSKVSWIAASLIAAVLAAFATSSFAAAPAPGGNAGAPGGGGGAVAPAAPAARGARRGGAGGGGGRGPVVAPAPTPVADLGMPIPDGVLPIKTASNAVIFVPRIATQPPILGPDGRGPSSPYWAVAIQADPGDIKVYADANSKLGAPKAGENRVVFLGDSITEKWQKDFGTLFPGKSNYIGRGIPAEATQQMLVRFRPDVIKLGAKVVVLQAGVGDVAGNAGETPDGTIHDNFGGIIDLAKVNNIKVVWVSTLPADHLFWRPGLAVSQRIADLVKWEKEYAAKHGAYFVDAFTPLKDEKNGLASKYTSDGVHPNSDGYKLISKLTDEQIQKALKGEAPSK